MCRCVCVCARWYFLTSVPSHSCRNETCHQGFPIDLQFGLSAKDTDCKAGQGKNILISKSAARGKELEEAIDLPWHGTDAVGEQEALNTMQDHWRLEKVQKDGTKELNWPQSNKRCCTN